MSHFKIYRINHYDPQIIGRKKRRQAILYGAMYTVFMALLQIGLNIFHIDFDLLFLALLPPILGIFLYLHFRFKSDLKQIKTIGEIEFTRTTIKKRIGDSMTEYEFNSIEKIELQKHIPALSAGISEGGYFSYILKIIFLDSTSESLVVSDKPTDKRIKISILDTMKTLKKFIKPEIIIKL